MKTSLYIDFIENAIKTDGYSVADKANKLALASKRITVSQYSKAAQLISRFHFPAFAQSISVFDLLRRFRRYGFSRHTRLDRHDRHDRHLQRIYKTKRKYGD